MEKIIKVNYVNQVYDQLNQMILDKVIAEGNKLPSEMTLAREMNVSRPVVREALQRLRAEHKIITHQGMGSYCANPLNYENETGEVGEDITEEEFGAFQQFRAALEYSAVVQAAERRTDEDLILIRSHLSAMLKEPPSDIYSQEDEAFHYSVYLATHNQMIIKAYAAVRMEVFRVLSYLNRHKGAHGISGNFHTRLFECIRDRTPEDAIRLMKAHDEYNYARVAEYQKLKGEKT